MRVLPAPGQPPGPAWATREGTGVHGDGGDKPSTRAPSSILEQILGIFHVQTALQQRRQAVVSDPQAQTHTAEAPLGDREARAPAAPTDTGTDCRRVFRGTERVPAAGRAHPVGGLS